MLFVGLHVKRMKELSDLAVLVLQQNIVISCVSVPIYMRIGRVYRPNIFFSVLVDILCHPMTNMFYLVHLNNYTAYTIVFVQYI